MAGRSGQWRGRREVVVRRPG